MNTLVQKYMSPAIDFQYNHHSKSVFPEENHVSEYSDDLGFDESPIKAKGLPTVDESSPEGESFVEKDHSNAIFKFISQMLMEEEDLGNKPCMLHDCLALQATEKSLYDVLTNNLDEKSDSPSNYSSQSSSDLNSFSEFNLNRHTHVDLESFTVPSPEAQFTSLSTSQSDLQPFLGSSKGSTHGVYRPDQDGFSMSQFWDIQEFKPNEKIAPFNDEFLRHSSESTTGSSDSLNSSKGKKGRGRGNIDSIEENRSSKQLANAIDEVDSLEMFDKVLLCSKLEPSQMPLSEKSEENRRSRLKEEPKISSRGRRKGVKKQGTAKEVVDLRSLLYQCAQAVASYDRRTANDLLARTRQHSSPHGDGNERVAHYFANALEARLDGTGTELYAAFPSEMISAAMILKSYKTFMTACPFRKMSNMFANKTIKKLATGATRIHIIDFGILYGFQWPCLIQALSDRAGGPPMLRITGIDFPQPGFRPEERVKDTGNRLAKYCKRFNVPFEYTAIARKWETIRVEDLKIDRNELLVVNSVYRLQNVPDETVSASSPRDVVLSLIKDINPDLFIHGAVNGTYNTPFFNTRFREALFHFSSMFDMFETSVPREDLERLLFEEQIFGKEIISVIACEGSERIERPETCKQWQSRNIRAGLRQIPLNQEIMKEVRYKVRRDYHKDFLVDEDGMWMLQGWKGRVIHGLSCWKPAHK